MIRKSMMCAFLLAALTSAVPAQRTTARDRTAGAERASPAMAEWVEVERRVTAAARLVIPATVGLRIAGAQGSGVIVSADGVIATAAHVFPRPGMDCRVVLSDGLVVKAVTLGRNESGDFGLIRMKDGGPWPWRPMGKSKALEVGDICLAAGHPGGYQRGRPPSLRLGRVLSVRGRFIKTSCVITFGDSGGPLFDLDGNVVGIHSRIQSRVTSNFHVPIDRFTNNWQRLLASESWGNPMPARRGPVIGIRGRDAARGCRVETVYDDRPARRAGVREGDVIMRVDAHEVKGIKSLQEIIATYDVGDVVGVDILRAGKTLHLEMKLADGRRESNNRRP